MAVGVGFFLAGWMRLDPSTQRELLRQYVGVGLQNTAILERVAELLPANARTPYMELLTALEKWCARA